MLDHQDSIMNVAAKNSKKLFSHTTHEGINR